MDGWIPMWSLSTDHQVVVRGATYNVEGLFRFSCHVSGLACNEYYSLEFFLYVIDQVLVWHTGSTVTVV